MGVITTTSTPDHGIIIKEASTMAIAGNSAKRAKSLDRNEKKSADIGMKGVRLFKIRAYVAQTSESYWGQAYDFDVDYSGNNRCLFALKGPRAENKEPEKIGYLPEGLGVTVVGSPEGELNDSDHGDLHTVYIGDPAAIEEFQELNNRRLELHRQANDVANQMRSMLGGGFPIIPIHDEVD